MALRPGKMNTAIDFFVMFKVRSRWKKNIFKIREDIPTQPIEVDIESTGIV